MTLLHDGPDSCLKILVVLAVIFAFAAHQPGGAQERANSGPSPAELQLRKELGETAVSKLRMRLEQVNRDIRERGIHRLPNSRSFLLTGYAYGEYYDWDLYFENLYLSYYGIDTYDFTNFELFMSRQQPDGFIARKAGITTPKPRQMFKPFLAQLAVLGSRQRPDGFEWLRDKYYMQLQRYLDKWFTYDSDHNGLPVWDSSDASGMDNQFSRSGKLDTYEDEGVDLACYLVRELRAMAVIADKLGKNADRVSYQQRAARLSTLINKTFWNDKDGFYYDRNAKTGRTIPVKSVAGFIPLWSGVASPKQAERLVKEHLLNAREFWTQYPVPSYARTEPDYYQGSLHGECNWRGSTWIPTNYMIVHGLARYGYSDTAHELILRTLRMALDENPVTREYYNAETGRGNGMNPFWGWSTLAYVMPVEELLHYDPSDPDTPVRAILVDSLNVPFDPRASSR
jgi:hypothetical protein